METVQIKVSGLARVSHRGTNPHLIFESTRNFVQSEIRPVFRSFTKSLVINPPGADLDRVATPKGGNTGMYFINPNLYARSLPPCEKYGLGQK